MLKHGHGPGNSPEYRTWSAMIQRTCNPRSKDFPNYGGRGIDVCIAWLEFENFLYDMGPRPPGTTLDRIDNSKGYNPDNCRWATREQQARNKRTTSVVEFEGEKITVAEYARRLGMSLSTAKRRLAAARAKLSRQP